MQCFYCNGTCPCGVPHTGTFFKLGKIKFITFNNVKQFRILFMLYGFRVLLLFLLFLLISITRFCARFVLFKRVINDSLIIIIIIIIIIKSLLALVCSKL